VVLERPYHTRFIGQFPLFEISGCRCLAKYEIFKINSFLLTSILTNNRKRRDALSSFFTKRNVLSLEPLITGKVEQLCQLITKHAVEKSPINLSDVFFAFCNEYESVLVPEDIANKIVLL